MFSMFRVAKLVNDKYLNLLYSWYIETDELTTLLSTDKVMSKDTPFYSRYRANVAAMLANP